MRRALNHRQAEFVGKRTSVYLRCETTAEYYAADARYVLIDVFKMEADWAYGMHLKLMC